MVKLYQCKTTGQVSFSTDNTSHWGRREGGREGVREGGREGERAG